MNYGEAKGALKGHELVIFGSLAGAVAAWFLVFRKNPTPVINVTTTPAPQAAATPVGIDTLGAAVEAGSAAALAGLQAGLATSPPATTPPPSTTSPVPDSTQRWAQVTGPIATPWGLGGLIYNSPPVIGFPIAMEPPGWRGPVVQVNFDGALWWEFINGEAAGTLIQYHDPAWSVG